MEARAAVGRSCRDLGKRGQLPEPRGGGLAGQKGTPSI